MNETQENLKALFEQASARIADPDVPDFEPEMARFLRLTEAHPEERAFIVSLFQRAAQRPGFAWELAQFCFHRLRWPEARAVFVAFRARDADDIRARRVWDHVLDSFQDDWSDAEFYREFSS